MPYINAHGVVSIRTAAFNASLSSLPSQTVAQATAVYRRWSEGGMLNHKTLVCSNTCQAEINPRHRAIFVKMTLSDACKQKLISDQIIQSIQKEMNEQKKESPQIWIWHWVGTHETYNRMLATIKRKHVLEAAMTMTAAQNSKQTTSRQPKPS